MKLSKHEKVYNATVSVCASPLLAQFQKALSKPEKKNTAAFCFPLIPFWHTLRLFKFVMCEWIFNEEAWRPRSKPPASSCTLYLLCCLTDIRTGLPQTKESDETSLNTGAKRRHGREGASTGVWVFKKKRKERQEIPKRQKQTSWNSRMEGTIIMQVIIHEITDLERERKRKSTGGKEPCSESHPCNYTIRTKWNGGRTHI